MSSLEPSSAVALRILGSCVPKPFLPSLLLTTVSLSSRVPSRLAFEGPPPFPTGRRATPHLHLLCPLSGAWISPSGYMPGLWLAVGSNLGPTSQRRPWPYSWLWGLGHLNSSCLPGVRCSSELLLGLAGGRSRLGADLLQRLVLGVLTSPLPSHDAHHALAVWLLP